MIQPDWRYVGFFIIPESYSSTHKRGQRREVWTDGRSWQPRQGEHTHGNFQQLSTLLLDYGVKQLVAACSRRVQP